MSTHVPRFQLKVFLHHFVLDKLGTCSTRVKERVRHLPDFSACVAVLKPKPPVSPAAAAGFAAAPKLKPVDGAVALARGAVVEDTALKLNMAFCSVPELAGCEVLPAALKLNIPPAGLFSVVVAGSWDVATGAVDAAGLKLNPPRPSGCVLGVVCAVAAGAKLNPPAEESLVESFAASVLVEPKLKPPTALLVSDVGVLVAILLAPKLNPPKAGLVSEAGLI